MHEAVIVEGVRTAVGSADSMLATVIKELMNRVGDTVDPADIEDVEVGCAMPEGSQGLNIARQVALLAGLPPRVTISTSNRGSGSAPVTKL